MTSESGPFSRLKAAPDLASATWAMQGFERPSGYNANVYGSGMHFDKRLAAAEQAALQFGNSVQAAGSQIDAGGNTAATGLAQAGKGAMAASQGMGAFGQILSGIGGAVGGNEGVKSAGVTDFKTFGLFGIDATQQEIQNIMNGADTDSAIADAQAEVEFSMQ